MSAHEASSTVHRPIRELICPDLEEPAGSAQEREQSGVASERRKSHRYRRRLPGILVIDGSEHPVICCDIGYGGMRVIAPDAVRVAPGSRVVVRINLGTRSFTDELSVVNSEWTAEGTSMNLSLSDADLS